MTKRKFDFSVLGLPFAKAYGGGAADILTTILVTKVSKSQVVFSPRSSHKQHVHRWPHGMNENEFGSW